MADSPSQQVELAIAVVPPTPKTNNNEVNMHSNDEQTHTITINLDNQSQPEEEESKQSENQTSAPIQSTALQPANDGAPQSNGDASAVLSPKDTPAQTNGAAASTPIEYPTKSPALAANPNHSAVDVIDEKLLIPIDELIYQDPYSSSSEVGLTSEEAQARLLRDGPNAFESAKPIPLWLAYFYQFANLLIILLIVSAVVAYALNEYIEATAIIIVVLVNVNLAVLSERNANNALAALMALSNPYANVIRDGKTVSVDSRNLVVGDIVQLSTGDVVPADSRVITAHSLEMNEMILTGESVPVRKNPSPSRADVIKTLTPPNLLLSGTNVQGGRGLALIVATGARTRLGEIAKLVTANAAAPKTKAQKTDEHGNPIAAKEPNAFEKFRRKLFSRRPPKTAMQKSIHKLGLGLSIIAVCVCILVFVIALARQHKNPDHPDEAVWLGALLIAVSLAVSSIPEGLPLAVTVALSLGGQRLAKCQALVRRIAAVENLGTVNIVCSDKTGTLTEGKMSVVQLSVGAQFYATLGNQITPIGKDDDGDSRTDNTHTMNTMNTMNMNANTSTANNQLTVGGEEKPKRKRSLLSAFHNRTFLSTRSMQDRPKKQAQANPFAAQTLNDNNRNQGNKNQSAYLRETLLVTRIATLCSNAELVKEEGSKQATATGNPTEAAIVLLADKLGLHAAQAMKQNPRVRELPFSSSRKMMFTCHDIQASDHVAEILGVTGKKATAGEKLYLTCGKGSPDMLLPLCTHYFAGQVKVEPMTDGHRATLMLHIDEMARQALRVIAIVAKVTRESPYKHASTDDEKSGGDDDEGAWNQQKRDLIMLGLLGIADPPRAGVADAIDVARGAGIKTVMITGDYLTTARAIARNIRLISKPVENPDPNMPKPEGEETVDCSALRPNGEYLPDGELDQLIANVAVFARAQPRDKLEIVKSLQRYQSKVVAMTGDGVNDSPALSQADIGIGMGSGTDVAKSASAIVLLDDKFPTIITAIKEGRSIYANIQKFIVFLIGTNAIQMSFILCCIIAGLPTPLTPLQILATNIITDALPALALSAMPAENDVMSQPPRNRKDFVINGNLRWLTFYHALSLVVVLPVCYVITLYWSSGAILQDDIVGLIDDEAAADPSLPIQERGEGCRVYSSDPPGWSRNWDPDCEKEAIRRGRSAVFLLLALAENCRPYTVRWLYYPFWHQLGSNIPLLCATALSLACLFIIMFVEPVQGVFGTDYLPWYDWLLVLGCVALTVIVDEIVKAVLYKRDRSHDNDDDDDEDKN